MLVMVVMVAVKMTMKLMMMITMIILMMIILMIVKMVMMLMLMLMPAKLVKSNSTKQDINVNSVVGPCICSSVGTPDTWHHSDANI